MNEQDLRTTAIQKSLGLSEQDALKVLIFISGMNAGKDLLVDERTAGEASPAENRTA